MNERNGLILGFVLTAAFCAFCFGYKLGYDRAVSERDDTQKPCVPASKPYKKAALCMSR